MANSLQIGFLRDIPGNEKSENSRVFTGDFDGGPVDLNHRPRPYQGLLWCYMHSSVAMITLLTTSLKFVPRDGTDGKRILDYLGATMVQHAGPGEGQKDVLVGRAYDFVLAEQKKVVEVNDSKLILRYEAFAVMSSRVCHFGPRSEEGLIHSLQRSPVASGYCLVWATPGWSARMKPLSGS